MQEPFEFTYTLNSEESQTAVWDAITASAKTAKKEYEPASHFFTEETNLAVADPVNYGTDAFGPFDPIDPAKPNEDNRKYRLTSKVRSTDANPVKVFAICNGQLLIQPQKKEDGTINPDKVNLILKPSASYAPLKIKYFIYRGVNKADLMDADIMGANNKLKTPIEEDPDQPGFLKKIWKHFLGLIQSVTNTEPDPSLYEFPASLIGFDETQDENTLLEHYFRRKDLDDSYQIPNCSFGEHLGYFTDEIGLDIVLDYGDYQLVNQEELFKFDLKYARAKEHVFDTSGMTDTTKIKRYKEYIHQFLDAAAFWGSHIECGSISTTDTSNSYIWRNSADIYDKFLNKYQTQNNIYVYIQGENNRSYNYYDTDRKVYGFNPDGELNYTKGWPILIKELTTSQPETTKKESLSLVYDIHYADGTFTPYTADGSTYNQINIAIPESERHISIDVVAPNNNTSSYPKLERPSAKEEFVGSVFQYFSIKDATISGTFPDGLDYDSSTGEIFGSPTTAGITTVTLKSASKSETINFVISPDLSNIIQNLTAKTETVDIAFQINDTKSCAGFLMLYGNLKQEFPIKDYYNNLWPVNLETNSLLPTTEIENLSSWATYDRNSLINLDDFLDTAGVVQNKVFFDNGKKIKNGIVSRKTRRLYMAILKQNSTSDSEYDKLNIDTVTAGMEKSNISKELYIKNLYKDPGFSVYKGTFYDEVNINTLSLVHKNKVVKKKSFFHLGITDEEFNKLMYNPIPVLEGTPAEPLTQYLPADADNVFFHLQEDLTYSNTYVRKFRVGLRFEDNTGALDTIYPSYSENDVFVYTLDGFYFFSNEYSEYQEFFDDLSENCRIDFRPKKKSTTIDVMVNGTLTSQSRDTWDGNFGFDWCRIGDAGMSNDKTSTTYDQITGHYYNSSNPNIKLNPNAVVPYTFKKEKKEWQKMLNSYFSYPISNIAPLYITPWLSLYPSLDKSGLPTGFPRITSDGSLKCLVEAEVELVINILDTLSSLKIKYEKDYFDINSISATETTALNDVTDPKTGVRYGLLEVNDKSETIGTPHTLEIKIKALREFAEDKKIQVIATDSTGEKLAGELRIVANDKTNRKETNILFVNVKTNVPSRNYDIGDIKNGMIFTSDHDEKIETKITRFFNQALIDVQNFYQANLDVTPGTTTSPNPEYSPTFNSGIRYLPDGTFETDDDLISKVYSDFTEYNPVWDLQYNDCFIIFFVDEGKGSGSYGQSEGIGSSSRKVIVYSDGLNDTTSAHELLHTTGLYHTFSNSGELTLTKFLTDNIMDYSDANDQKNTYPIPVVSLWKRQWNITKKHALIKKES